MKNITSFLAAVVLLAILPLAARATEWVSFEKYNAVAHFFMPVPAKIERYDTSSKAWLAPLILPAGRGVITAATLDSEGIYVAYDKAVYRYDLAGGNERHLLNTTHTVQGLFTDGNLLLINQSSGLYARVISVNKANNAVIAEMENYIYAINGASIARGVNRLVGTTQGISPADVSYVEYRDDGTFVGGGDSPHHGSYTIGTRTWVFPDSGRFVDTTGRVYGTSSLSYALSFGSPIVDLDFSGDDVPIVLSGNKIIAYRNTLLPAGSVTLSSSPKSILVVGDSVIAFTPTAEKIMTETISLAALHAPAPGQPANPEGLDFLPESVFVDGKGIVCLFSKVHQTIFRWNPATQSYIDGIPLIGMAEFAAYSAENDTIYTAYTSGLIRKIDLKQTKWVEEPFVQLPSSPLGLATAGPYVFAVDPSGAWSSHYTYTADGSLVSSVEWNYYSKAFVWNAANQKMYFFRDDTSPNDLLSEEINANGTAYPALPPGGIGTKKDSPLHTSTGFAHPIRPSPDGSHVVLGSGVIHAGVSLERLPSGLGDAFTDGAWGTAGFYSSRSVSESVQFQQWLLPSYALGAVLQVPGTPRHLIALPGVGLFALNSAPDGVPSFYLFNEQFSVLPPPDLVSPGDLAASVKSATEIQLQWRDVSGEASYRIERRMPSSGDWTQIGTTTISVTNFVDTAAQVGSVYEYRVLATNGTLASTPGEPVTIEFRVPAQPTLSASLISTSQIRLDWAAAARATDYRLLRRIGTDTAWSQIAAPSATTVHFLNSSLSADTTYHYKLQALNSLGVSEDSEVVTLTTPQIPPGIPSLYSPSADSTTVSLYWSAAARTETYRIERKNDTEEAWTVIATVPAPATQYLDQTVKFNTLYTYRLFAVNAAGESSASLLRQIQTPDLPLPTAPTELSGEPLSGTQILLSWIDSANEGGYRVERRIGEAAWAAIATVPTNSVSFLDTTAETGRYYNYRVVAFNERGETTSTEMNLQATRTGSIVLDTFDPSINYGYWQELLGASVLTGQQGFQSGNALWMGGNGTRRVALAPADTSAGGRLKFIFRAGNSADGSTHWDVSEAGENVILEYAAGTGSWQFLAMLNTEYPDHSGWTSHDIHLPQGARSTNARFRWHQTSHSGAAFDTWALDNVEIVSTVPDVPQMPPFVMGSANSSRSVALSWVASQGATSYVLERRTTDAAWTAVGTTGIGQTYFTDTTAQPATLYSYRVIARNAGGASPPSDHVFIATWSLLAEWRFQNYGTLADTGAAGSLEDNGTGVPNLAKFAFNMAGNDHFYSIKDTDGTRGLPSMQIASETGVLRVAFIRRRGNRNPGIEYVVEFSSDLSSWAKAGREILSAPIDEDFEYVVWEDAPADASEQEARFGRVRVSE